MEKISALMDGELDATDSRVQIRRLAEDAILVESWATFHLIGDCLRNEGGMSTGFMKRVSERLAEEPTVVAPRPMLRRPSPFVRHTLPLAAAIAGVAVVAWLGLSSPLFSPSGTSSIIAQSPPPAPAPAPAGHTAPLALRGSVSDYLTAHQEFSPRTAMQGVASYVRTVADEQQIQDR